MRVFRIGHNKICKILIKRIILFQADLNVGAKDWDFLTVQNPNQYAIVHIIRGDVLRITAGVIQKNDIN